MSFSRTRVIGPEYYPSLVVGTLKSWNPVTRQWVNPIQQKYPSVNGLKLSEETACWDELHPGPPYRSGGPFFLLRQKIPNPVIASGSWILPGNMRYDGEFHINMPNDLNTQIAEYTSLTAETFGAQAWNKFRPAKPTYNVGQAIGELRDFPGMIRFRLKTFLNLGSAYLAYKFGWAPFLKDVAETIKAMDNVEKAIARLRKMNGKWEKRGGVVRSSITTTTAEGLNMISPVLPSYFYPGYQATKAKVITTKTDEIWFKGRMKYYIPGLKDRPSVSDMCFSSPWFQKVLGLEITPSLLWELLPWSWLVDWFVDFGALAANMSAIDNDNLVAKYAYVMRRRKTITLYEQTQNFNGGPSVHFSAITTCESKERAEASPFGFGLSLPDLSETQLAILLALGVSRLW